MIGVTAYIPAYNAAEYLPHSIEGLLQQTAAPDEILIIDDGSTDATAEIAAHYPRVTLVRHECNQGLACARNTALRVARYDLIASLDADCVATPGWLATLLPYLNDQKVVGVGGFLKEGIQRTVADRWRRARMAQEWGPALIRNPKFLFGSNNVFRKAPIIEAGGYNESLRTCGEDPDLARRLGAKGWELVYEPAALATHLRHDNTRSILDMYWRWWKFGNQAYPAGITLRSLLGTALFIHFRFNFLDPAKADLRAGRFDLLALDFLALGYLPYRDFRLWLNSNSAAASQRSAAGA